jgi:tetratricopeptide (TPR) repeat protein
VHAEGILHRDIKAQNVMLEDAGRVVLMDFGAGAEQSDHRGSLSGTPLYMAPEVLSGLARPSVASDIYSIGVLLYFALTGSCPVNGIDLEAVRAAHEQRRQRPVESLRPDVPRWLRKIIAQALHHDPAARFETAAALAEALDPRRRPRRRVQAVVTIAALAALSGTAAWIAPGSGGPTGAELAPGRAVDTSIRARALAEREGVADTQRAVQLFERVVASNPEYAPAHAGLAVAYAYLSMAPYRGVPFGVAHARMRAAADQAVRLDPGLADAHVARGWVSAREFAWQEAEQSFRRAIALAPAGVAAYTGFSYSTLLPLGRTDEAERLVRDAARIDPSAPEVWRELGRVLLQAGRARAAVEALEPLRTRPEWNLPLVDVTLGRALVLDGRAADALPLLERVVDPALGPGPWLAWAYVALGRRGDAERLARDNDTLPYRRAIISAAIGDRARMFDALSEMHRSEPQRLPMLLRAPEFAPFHTDPRFVELLRSLRLVPADHR